MAVSPREQEHERKKGLLQKARAGGYSYNNRTSWYHRGEASECRDQVAAGRCFGEGDMMAMADEAAAAKGAAEGVGVPTLIG